MSEKLCTLDELSENRGLEFSVIHNGEKKEIFVFLHGRKCIAYLNSCPHTGVNLNWQPGQFFSIDNKYIECSMHGALFEPLNGECLHGPCIGQKLSALELTVINNEVFIEDKPAKNT